MGSSRQPFLTVRHILTGVVPNNPAYLAGLAVSQYPATAQYLPIDPPVYTLSGCHYRPTDISPITYRYDQVHSFNRSAFSYGKNLWNATAAPGHFLPAQSWDSRPEVVVQDSYFIGEARNYLAVAKGGCDLDGNRIWYGNKVIVEFNHNTYARGGLRRWGLVAGHELGPAYGLGHTSGCTLMNAWLRYCTDNYPTASDIEGVSVIYRSLLYS